MGLFAFPAQAQLDNYKYFVVPKRFDAFKEINQYQSSTLVKFLLTKYGFETVYADAIPEELFLDKCLGLNSQLEDNSTYLQTVVAIVFNDCRGQEVFRTQEGRSKSKEFKEAYSDAIQEAMQSMALITHNYQGSAQQPYEGAADTATKKTVDTIPEADVEVASTEPEVMAVASEAEPLAIEVGKTVSEEVKPSESNVVYWEQLVSNSGFILTHPEKEVTWVIMKTSSKEVFMAVSTTIQGVAFKVKKGWRLEYYLGDVLQVEHLQLGDQ